MNLDLYPLLAKIDSPADLRHLPANKLEEVCNELRAYLLSCVSQSSGHLASGLGTVELTVALHYVYNTPFDHIVWDVGHQAYPHKILTGRRNKMTTIRQKNGLHPFPWRGESNFDVFSVGHSSTSISAGLGLAIAAQKENSNRRTVCIIGDGAMTAGMAYEAINHAGHLATDMLVILNDNDMSISKNVGALSKHLTQLFTGKMYASLREGSKKAFSGMPPLKELLKKTEEHLKGIVTPTEGTLFEQFGFNYIGPIDGHDINTLVQTLHNMRELKGPQLLHVITKKGKGYAPAEKDPTRWHGVPKFDPHKGCFPAEKHQAPTYSTIFGDWLCDTAKYDNKLIAITPAMSEGSGMAKFAELFPEQFFDVGIAEQHAVTLAAGLAIGGFKPVVAIYSTFLQRSYDQIIHDIAIQNVGVLFAIDRAGVVGPDGATHQGAFDIAFLRCIPNLILMTPSDENECRQMLYSGYHYHSPVAVRYPKGSEQHVQLMPLTKLIIGKGKICRHGQKVVILNFGILLREAIKAADELNATVVDMRFVKPLDEEIIIEMAATHQLIVTIEEGSIAGGAGSAVSEFLSTQHKLIHFLQLGLPDQFINQGTRTEILSDLNLDATGFIRQIKDKMQKIS